MCNAKSFIQDLNLVHQVHFLQLLAFHPKHLCFKLLIHIQTNELCNDWRTHKKKSINSVYIIIGWIFQYNLFPWSYNHESLFHTWLNFRYWVFSSLIYTSFKRNNSYVVLLLLYLLGSSASIGISEFLISMDFFITPNIIMIMHLQNPSPQDEIQGQFLRNI